MLLLNIPLIAGNHKYHQLERPEARLQRCGGEHRVGKEKMFLVKESYCCCSYECAVGVEDWHQDDAFSSALTLKWSIFESTECRKGDAPFGFSYACWSNLDPVDLFPVVAVADCSVEISMAVDSPVSLTDSSAVLCRSTREYQRKPQAVPTWGLHWAGLFLIRVNPVHISSHPASFLW